MDFVTANDHVMSAIIAHMRTVLTQVKRCLLIVKNAFIYEGAFKIWTVKEQRPGFTGLVKRVDTVAETRVVVVDTWGDTCMVTFSVLDICSVFRFPCFIFLIKRCSINLCWCYVFL